MVALLAPVPHEHLLSGLKTVANEGKVAFGTRAFEVFAHLRDNYADAGRIEALIYESDSRIHGGPPCITWRAVYVGYEGSETGGHSGDVSRGVDS